MYPLILGQIDQELITVFSLYSVSSGEASQPQSMFLFSTYVHLSSPCASSLTKKEGQLQSTQLPWFLLHFLQIPTFSHAAYLVLMYHFI